MENLGIIILACHHKSGTMYNKKVFKKLANYLKIKFNLIKNNISFSEISQPSFNLLTHSSIPQVEKIFNIYPHAKFIHIIRNPRSMLISSTLYHKKSSENWLVKPNPKYNMKSYQEFLNSKNLKDALLIELQRSGNIRKMIQLEKYFNDKLIHNGISIKLEDLSHDTTLKTYFDFFSFIGLKGKDLLKAINFASNNSLWYLKNTNHSTLGVTENLIDEFDKEVEGEFTKIFPNANQILNYN